jgi:CheY-like chemotaxis protein
MADPKTPPQIDTVLVVDDDVIARMAIAEYLRHCGFRVIEAADTDEALVVLPQSDLKTDVVLCGVTRAAAGFAIAQWVRQNRPDTDVILAGNHARAADAAGDLCESGPHVGKPYQPHVVVDRIKRLRAARTKK